MIPGLGATSTTARVRVVDAMMDGEGVSDSLFTIVAAPSGVDDGTIWNSDFVLSGNYPNPFSAYTELRWSQGHGGDIEVRIYRPDGARVAAYPVGHREAGEQRFVVNGAPLSSGPYLYEIWLDDVPLRGVMTVVR